VRPEPQTRRAENEVSVTEVRNALRCPRVFALGRARGQPVVFPVGASSLGALFHRIAERFARELDAPPPRLRRLAADAAPAAIADAVGAWLIGHLVAELSADPSYATMPGEVDDLAEALRELARYLAAEVTRSGLPAADALRAMIPHAELAVEAVIDDEHTVVRLTGRIDAVHSRALGAIDVVEYKLTDEANQELDQAQVALYRLLLKKALDAEAEPVILRFNPGLVETRLSPAASDAIVERKLLPYIGRMVGWAARPETAPATTRRDLCPACPVRRACAETYREPIDPRDRPPAGATRPRPDAMGSLSISEPAPPGFSPSIDTAGQAEADELTPLIVAQLRKRGVAAAINRVTVGPSLLRIEVSTPRQPVAQLDRAAADVEHHLEARQVRFGREGPKRVFVAPRRTPRPVEMAALLAARAAFLREKPGRFVVGEAVDGDVVTGDLSDGSTCHLLVAGQTGSGKSVLLRGLVTSMCHFHPPAAIRFTLVDPKRVTFGVLAAAIAAHLTGPVIHDAEALLPELDDLVDEMEARYRRFEARGAEDIDDYNAAADEPLPRRVVVVDEFQDLLADRATRSAFLDGVKRLGAKARAAGIHLVLATQRPDRNTVPGEIKANLGGKIALRVQAAVNSRIILDQGGAERLLGKGDLLADLGHGVVRAQAPLS
jgi:S-DNA-T family DNA segregation ATPase FtsK/SpoIIIE